MSFTFELALGDDTVKRVTFPTARGKRDLRTSNGVVIGRIVLTANSIRVELDDDAAQAIVDAQFHEPTA